MLGIIVTGHGHFATGLTSSLDLIAGPQKEYVAVDFEQNDSTDDLEKKLRAAFEELKGSNGIIVFEKDGKYGLVTCWGVYVPPIYNELTEDEHELVHADLNGQWGHISGEGTFISDEDEDTFDNTYCLSFGVDD